uniref:Protein-L-isoaspartate O-methyltransferase n=1 Tax=candidate division WOR-3 bacterium TaxID=2052148 RepID=A0A7C3J745_UNCW3
MLVDELNNKMVESFLEKFKKMNLKEPDKNIVEGFLKVYRHYFTPFIYFEDGGVLRKENLNYSFLKDDLLRKIYVDTPLVVLAEGDNVITTSSQPFVMALMLRDANVREGGKILEIGTGSGYNAAIIAYICKKEENVVSIEIDKKVADFALENLKRANFPKVKVINQDGGLGYSKEGPYDSIIVTCGAPEIPFFDQLKDGGYLSIPLVTRGIETLVSFKREKERMVGKLSIFVKFLHFEGVFSDKKHFAKNIQSLQRVVETYGKRRDDLKEQLSDLIEKENDSEHVRSEKRRRRANFNFFIAISNDDAIMYESDVKGRENGYGLWNTILKSSDNGLIILFNDEIVSWGSEKLVERYISFYKRWKELNSPEIGDYIVEFYPENNLSIEDDKVFQIKRKYGTTLFKLV